jgi:uncharacterized protein with FMN-binding domain
MKKYIIAGVLVVAFVAYLVFANKGSTPVAVVSTTTPTTTDPAPATGTVSGGTTSGGTGTGSGSGSTSGGTTTGTIGQYKDGTYTGSVADAFYGKLQAVVTIKGGLITNVTFPQAPSGGNSSEVSAFALPALKQEAIAAQSANVNTVSGATQDSQAFNESLAVALAQAKN